MIEDMTVRNLSPETQDAYVRAAAKLGKHFHCSPDLLGPEDISACQVHLPARCLLRSAPAAALWKRYVYAVVNLRSHAAVSGSWRAQFRVGSGAVAMLVAIKVLVRVAAIPQAPVDVVC
jgi:hypothetical protein